MRGLGTLIILAFVIGCGLCVSGLILQKVGATDQMVSDFVKQEGWGAGTSWNVEQQWYAVTVLHVRTGISRGEASAKLLLIGGVPVRTYQAGAYGLEPSGARR